MTFQEFIQKITGEVKFCTRNKDSWGSNPFEVHPKELCSWESKKDLDQEVQPQDLWVVKAWEVGGSSGGSCWNGSKSEPYVSDNKEPDFVDLETILSLVSPKITFLEYKKLLRDLGSKSLEGEYSVSEYYCNKVQFKYEAINLKDLYDVLFPGKVEIWQSR